MKLFSTKYDTAQPTLSQINVDTNTDYKVGIELYNNGENITDKVMPSTLSCDGQTAQMVNNIPCFQFSSGNTPNDKSIQIDVASEKVDSLVGADNEWFEYHQNTQAQLPMLPFTPTTFLKVKKPFVLRPKNYADPSTITYPPNGYRTPFSVRRKRTGDTGEWYDITDESFNNYPSNQIIFEIFIDVTSVNWDRGAVSSNERYYFEMDKTGDTARTYLMDAKASSDDARWPKELYIPEDSIISFKDAVGQLEIGTELNTSFKIAINENKTSIGDIDTLGRTNTTTLSGLYADDTPFSFEVYTK